MSEHQKNLSVGFAMMALPLAVVVGLLLKYGGTNDPAARVYADCIQRHDTELRADADLARRIERVCHVEQAAAYTENHP